MPGHACGGGSAHDGFFAQGRAGGVRPGACGGWRIDADLSTITLRQLHEALGEPIVFAMGNRHESPECLVEQSVNAALDKAFVEAEALLLNRFSEITLADLAADFAQRHASHQKHANHGAVGHAA